MIKVLQNILEQYDLPIIIGYTLAVGSLVLLYSIYFIHRGNVMQDLRGKDRMWQIIELSAVAWLILMPMMVVCDLLGVEANTQVWTSLDVIYMVNVGGKMYLANKFKVEEPKKKENEINPDQLP